MTLRVQFESPISRSQARANGIADASAHLLIARSNERAANGFEQVFEKVLSKSEKLMLLVFGEFEPETARQTPQWDFLGTTLGAKAYGVGRNGLWSLVSAMRAEWLAFIDRRPSDFDIIAKRLERESSQLLKLSVRNELGTLASQSDLIDPLSVYYPLNQVLELFGTNREVLNRLDMIRHVAFT